MKYTIRPATQADVPGITKVAYDTWNITYAQSIAAHNRRQFLDQAFTPETLHEATGGDRGWLYVAVRDKSVVGFAQYQRRFDGHGELVHIYIQPDHQRRGIGRALLASGLVAMFEVGIRYCYVSAKTNNVAARRFYERFGFHPYRAYGRFLGDQIIQLVEYCAPLTSLLNTSDLGANQRMATEQG